MDPNELIKAAPEVAKIAGPLAAAIPFTSIVKRMLGPAADEVAEMWRDQVRVYRYERQLKCVEKAERMAEEAGFTPQPVPPKILFPLLEGASFEEDETLHDMWAALLANSAVPEKAEKVRPGFIAILKEMSSDEAELLQNIAYAEAVEEAKDWELYATLSGGLRIRKRSNEDDEALKARLDLCQHLLTGRRLLFPNNKRTSQLGKAFLEAVRPPAPTK